MPVRASSAPSEKLDFPDPFLPTTSVTPGPGLSPNRAGSPMPRRPSTVMSTRNIWGDFAVLAFGGAGRGVVATPPRASLSSSSPSAAARMRLVTSSARSAAATLSTSRSSALPSPPASGMVGIVRLGCVRRPGRGDRRSYPGCHTGNPYSGHECRCPSALRATAGREVGFGSLLGMVGVIGAAVCVVSIVLVPLAPVVLLASVAPLARTISRAAPGRF